MLYDHHFGRNRKVPDLSLPILVAPLIVCIAALLSPQTAQAGHATVTHNSFPGTEHEIIDISGFMTTGEDMGGMRVTAHFTADLVGASETVFWNPIPTTGAGNAIGNGWRLDQAGDTWDQLWRLDVTATAVQVFGLTLEGFLPTDQVVEERATVFDRTDPFFGTAGSFRGRDLEIVADEPPLPEWDAVRVGYIDQVKSAADPLSPHGDIFRVMQIQFGQIEEVPGQFDLFIPEPFVFGDVFTFLQDTDTVGERIVEDCVGEECIPEPSSVILLATGFVAASLWKVRRKRGGG